MGATRKWKASELALVIGFLLVLAAVPVTQSALEVAWGEQVQFTDVFRYRPTAKNLRQYEATLKEKSWFQQKLRPQVQGLLFAALGDLGAKAVAGRDGWLFYRPDLRYLVDRNQVEQGNPESKWVAPGEGVARQEAVAQAIVAFRDQLRERGITLMVLPVPGKPGVYAERLTRREAASSPQLASPTLELIRRLRQSGVEAVDLFSLFRGFRGTNVASEAELYLARDTHWTPLGARLAAEAVANRLRALGLAPGQTNAFATRSVQVGRWGDILEMAQIPGLREAFAPERVACEQVTHPALGLLLPSASERPGTYRYPGEQTRVLVLGDSFLRIYQYPEPQSLGEPVSGVPTAQAPGVGSKLLLPGSAGFVSHLMRALQAPVDAIYSDGGASTDVRRKLSTNPEILEAKTIVIWEFVERDIALGRTGWETVPLPPKLD